MMQQNFMLQTMGYRQHWEKSETVGLHNWKQMKESMKQFFSKGEEQW